MQTSSVSSAASTSGTQVVNSIEQTLGKDAFLKLLITQIRYQDPLSPMEDKDFIAQLAQFSTLEQMQEMNTGVLAFQLMSATAQALSLVGREVTAQVPGEAEPITGKVDAVTFKDSRPVLVVGEREIELAWVSQVR